MEWQAEDVKFDELQEHLNQITLEKFEVYGIYPITHKSKVRGVTDAQARTINTFMVVSRKG